MDEIFQGRLVRRADMPSSLSRAPVEPALRYEYQGRSLDLEQYLAGNPATGLLIARDDTILVERYQYARTDRHRFTSQSMAKTVTAMLIGIAIAEAAFARSTIRLQRTSPGCRPPSTGVRRSGTCSRCPPAFASRGVLGPRRHHAACQRHVLARRARRRSGDAVQRAGRMRTWFSYASVETQVLGLQVVPRGRALRGRLPAREFWQPIGAEADATRLVDRSGHEATFCCLNAVLRDWGASACCSPTTATGAVGRSFPPPGSGTPPPCVRTSRI